MSMLTKVKNTIFNKSAAFHIYALGVCVMCGKQAVKWQQGFGLCGLYLFLVVSAVYIGMHLVLTYSFAELISIVPFSGGGYAYSRCSLGPTIGYFIGMVELGKYILYTVTSINRIGLIFQDAYEFETKYVIAVCAIFVASVNILHMFNLRLIWMLVGILGVTIVAIQFMFVVGAMEKGTTDNMSHSVWESDPQLFLKGLPYTSYLIVSADAVRTCVDNESKKVVPRALIASLIWSAMIAFATIVAQSAYFPSDSSLLTGAYAYNGGFTVMFPTLDASRLQFFALPGTIGCSFGFLYCSARQMRSMACSGLLPTSLAWGQKSRKVVNAKEAVKLEGQAFSVVPSESASEEETLRESDTKPTLALFVCSVLCVSLAIVGYYLIDDASETYLHTVSLLRCIQYVFMMIAYTAFATRFSGMTREFPSPFGIAGALSVLGFFILMFVSNLYYYEDSRDQGIVLVFYFVVSLIYYVFVVQKRQFFSKEEQDKFLKAYVVNANRARKNSKRDASQSRTLFYYLTRVWSRNKVNPGRSRSGTGTRPKSLKGASRNSSSLQATS